MFDADVPIYDRRTYIRIRKQAYTGENKPRQIILVYWYNLINNCLMQDLGPRLDVYWIQYNIFWEAVHFFDVLYSGLAPHRQSEKRYQKFMKPITGHTKTEKW